MSEELTSIPFEDRQYLLIDTSELYLVNFNEVVGDDRRNNLQTKSIIKWDSLTEPNFVESLTTKQGPYTNAEILQILSANEWQIPNGFI